MNYYRYIMHIDGEETTQIVEFKDYAEFIKGLKALKDKKLNAHAILYQRELNNSWVWIGTLEMKCDFLNIELPYKDTMKSLADEINVSFNKKGVRMTHFDAKNCILEQIVAKRRKLKKMIKSSKTQIEVAVQKDYDIELLNILRAEIDALILAEEKLGEQYKFMLMQNEYSHIFEVSDFFRSKK